MHIKFKVSTRSPDLSVLQNNTERSGLTATCYALHPYLHAEHGLAEKLVAAHVIDINNGE